MMKPFPLGRAAFALSALFVGTFLILTERSAFAQGDYPSRPIRITLGFAAGTSPDVALRVFAEKLSKQLGQPIVIESATGAAGNIAGHRVANAQADGYDLLFASSSSVVVSPALYKAMRYNPLKDLKPISILYSHPNVLVVSNRLGVRNLQELIAKARNKPGELNAASAGTGTTQHLAIEMLCTMADARIAHVPYRGGMNLIQDLLSGEVSMTFAVPTNVMAQVETGELTALAVTSAKRSRFLPALPTMAESGLPDFEISVWWGLMAPTGTPDDVIEILHKASAAALAMPDVRKRFDDMNLEMQASSPAEFAQIITAEAPKWAALIGRIGIKLD